MSDVEIVDLTTICLNFPETPKPEILREHLLQTIDTIFEDDTYTVIVEGEEGIGKTTFLAQYAKRHPDNAFSLFIRPTNRLAYDPDYLRRELAEQLHWAIHDEPLKKDEVINESFLKTQIPLLQRHAQRTKQKYYFVVDGLDDIPNEDAPIREAVLRDILLSIGFPQFRFLLSGNCKQISSEIHYSINCKPFSVPYFSLSETKKYLSDLQLNEQVCKDIHRMCGNGVPGKLASVRRQQYSGIDIQNIIEADPDDLPDFIGMEWLKANIETDEQKKLFALIAYSRRQYMPIEISRILHLEYHVVENLLQKSQNILTTNHQNEIGYLSEPHQKYAAKQLHRFKDEVINLLIEDLLKDPTNEVALIELPDYYEQTGRLNDLLSFLTPAHLTEVLQQSHSLMPVQRMTSMGLMASEKLKKNEALLRFSMQKSVMGTLLGSAVWRSEIQARMSVGEYESARALAESAVLKVDQLHLLAVIAKMKKKKGLLPEEGLIQQINRLYEQIDHSTLGERAVEIASDLIWSEADLGIKLLEASTETQEDQNALDRAFARLSLDALRANSEQSQYADTIEKTQSKIQNPQLQNFSAAAAVLFGEYSAAEIIQKVEKLDFSNRLFVLRQWTLTNQENVAAADVVEYALDLLIKNVPQNTPTARDYHEIAIPLPFVKDPNKARELVGKI